MAANNVKYKKMAAAVAMVLLLVAAFYWLAFCSEKNDKAPVVGAEIETNHDSHANSTDVIAASPTSGAVAESGTPGPLPSPGPASPDESIASVEELPLPAFDDKYVDAVMRVPVHKWQKERSANIAAETIEQTIRNFASIDDMHLAATSISGIPPVNTSPAFQSLVLTRLARVRRVLSEGRDDPGRVVPHLRNTYDEALMLWPKAYLDRRSAKERHGLSQAIKCEKQAIAATYLLAELGDHESLPALLKGYKIHQYPRTKTAGCAPVPPALTLYAMHRLIQSFPEEKLNAEARKVRTNYLEQAKCLPPPRDTLAAKSWYTGYDESDPRIVIMDPERRVLRGEPTMSMVVYPYRFTDGEDVSGPAGRVSERAKLLFAELEKFIEAQYGDR